MIVRSLTDRAEIQPLLERERFWAGYALGDLAEGLFEQCDWFAADDALVLFFKGLDFRPLVTFGSAAGIEAILETALTPPQIFLNQRPEQLPAVEKFYRSRELHPMWRMALPIEAWSPRSTHHAIQLGREREAEMREVYRAGNGGDAFAAFQLALGYFYGIECDGQLVAVAGVHIASQKYRVGAVGNVCTHPAYRGRGFGAACTSAVVQALLHDGIDTIFLNVEQTNHNAMRVYEQLGFVKYCEFVEGLADRK